MKLFNRYHRTTEGVLKAIVRKNELENSLLFWQAVLMISSEKKKRAFI